MRRPTTLRQARGRREMWPHVVDARRVAPVCHRAGDGWETRLVPFTPTEDLRPVCTKCRERIEDGHDREYDEKRAGFFRHASYVCPSKQPTYYIKGDPADLADAMRKALGPNKFIKVKATAPSVEVLPAPPVDEELERERKRLVGKRVRFSGQKEVFVATKVARDDGDNIVVALDHHGVAQDGEFPLDYFVVIPDAKPRHTTFGELAIGEWFMWAHGAAGGIKVGDHRWEWRIAKRADRCFARLETIDLTGPTHVFEHVTRIDPPTEKLVPF